MSKIYDQTAESTTQARRMKGKTSRNLYQSMEMNNTNREELTQHKDFLTIIEDDLNLSKNSNHTLEELTPEMSFSYPGQ